MEMMIQSVVIIATIAAVHERAIELIRSTREKYFPVKTWPTVTSAVDVVTTGEFNFVPALVLAFVTNANLLYLFPNGEQRLTFFDHYLEWEPGYTLKRIVGLSMMGFAITLGSQFWHDLARGLIDLRAQAKRVARNATASDARADTGERENTEVESRLRPTGS